MGPKHGTANDPAKSRPQWNSLPFDSEQGFILVYEAEPSPWKASLIDEAALPSPPCHHQVGTFTKDLVLQKYFIWGSPKKQLLGSQTF